MLEAPARKRFSNMPDQISLALTQPGPLMEEQVQFSISPWLVYLMTKVRGEITTKYNTC